MDLMNSAARDQSKTPADLELSLGAATFTASFCNDLSPQVCAEMRRRLPVVGRALHSRWSGEAVWLPLGFVFPPMQSEHATSYPAPGDVLIKGPDASEAELLIAYGACRFASRAGQLAGAPFLSIRDKLDLLAQVGREMLEHGSMDLIIRQIR